MTNDEKGVYLHQDLDFSRLLIPINQRALRKEIIMNAFKTLMVAIALTFLTMGTFAQTTVSAADSTSASVVSQDGELAKKIALAQAYLEKEVLEYTVSGVYEGTTYKMKQQMFPKGQYAQFSSANPCGQGKIKTLFSVNPMNGNLIADIQPRASFCPRVEYHFDVVTHQGKRIAFDAVTKQQQPEDTTLRVVLE